MRNLWEYESNRAQRVVDDAEERVADPSRSVSAETLAEVNTSFSMG